MPWHLEQRANEVCVVKDADGSTAGCHPDRASAQQQLAALYAAEPSMRADAEPGCSCQHHVGDAGVIVAAAIPAMRELVVPQPRAREAATMGTFDEPYPTPLYPPRNWFDKPDWLEPGQGLTVTDDGQVAGYFYQAGACLVHMHGACPKPSPTGYAAFHQQDAIVSDGETLRVGAIGNVNGHASEYSSVSVAQAHYADPDAQMIICRAGDDDHGGWFAGALVPGLTYGDVALVRRCALSGDWRPMPASWWQAHGIPRRAVTEAEGYDCIGPTFVTRPGLPLVRQYARTAATLARWFDPEENTVIITAPDGTIIEGEPENVVSALLTMLGSARTAASPDAGMPPGGDAGPPEGGETDAMAQLDARLSALEDTVGQIVDMINQSSQQQAAAMEAAVIPLPEADLANA